MEYRLNLAISNSGMEKLLKKQQDDPDLLETLGFERSYREGMYSKHRSILLGDADDDAPEYWQWGNETKRVDLLLLLFSKDEASKQKYEAEYEAAFAGAGLISVECIKTPKRKTTEDDLKLTIEHFGFSDGVSDPVVEGFLPPSDAIQQPTEVIATGEFLLGYPNQYDGKETQIPVSREFGINGTYLVLRQLKQNVAAFWQFINAEATQQNISPDYLAAKMVGRWQNGVLVEPNQTAAPNTISNDFDFSKDPDGNGCPFGSHIRRANPRAVGLGTSDAESLTVANRHRLLRRGRSYGDALADPLTDDGQERGLVFICLNANIERQFEFVQHTWINNVKFAGLYDEDDPLIGRVGNFTIPDQPLRRRVCGFQQFVGTRGGGYFFLPSLSALAILGKS
jgi:Dyp-type peroxidase family